MLAKSDLDAAGNLVIPDSSMLIVVGGEDTGDLEAQIRGSRYAWDIRLVSDGDQGLAEEQADLLRHAYEGIENLRDAVSFLFSGFWSGVAGLLFIYYNQFVSPHVLGLTNSAEALTHGFATLRRASEAEPGNRELLRSFSAASPATPVLALCQPAGMVRSKPSMSWRSPAAGGAARSGTTCGAIA